jgi:replicative DNA helicase
MSGSTELSKEQRVMRAMRMTLASVVKDTTPQPGMHHVLSDQTIEDIKACFALISAREMELAQEAGLAQERPHFTDDTSKAKVVSITKPGRKTEE